MRGGKKLVIAAMAVVLIGLLAWFVLPQYSLTFYSEGEPIEELQLRLGSKPEAFEPQLDGCEFVAWLDGDGNEADPFARRVSEDAEYSAEWRVVLGGHEPFLFADERGFIRPDEPLTGSELRAALEALAPDGTEALLPAAPDGAVTGEQLTVITRELFPDAAIEFSANPTRAEFASAYTALLGRVCTGITAAEGAALPPDIALAGDDREAVLEASVPHTAGGGSWEDVAPAYEPGLVNLSGELFSIDKNGELMLDCDVGTLHFDDKGRYTSGNELLDGYAKDIIAGFMLENPEAGRLELLRMAYDYTRDSFTYLRRNYYAFGETGWEIDEAITMLETGRGNCYCYAAVFWALARQLGFDAEAISGTISRTSQPHAWVEIVIDGTNYYFDPETEMAYIQKRDYGYDMFMMNYYYARTWSYRG